MSNPDFASILDEAPTTVERPKPMPAGPYLCVVKGQPRRDVSSKKKTPFTEFTLQPIQALEGVDEEELNAWMNPPDKEPKAISDGVIKATYYETAEAIYRLDEFHEHCGIDLSVPASRSTRNSEVVNSQVIAVLRHEASDDGTTLFARLARTAPAE